MTGSGRWADEPRVNVKTAFKVTLPTIGFAIPAPTAVDVVRQLVRDSEVSHAYLGAQLRPLTPRTAQALGIEAEGGADGG